MRKHISLLLAFIFTAAVLCGASLALDAQVYYATEPVNLRTGPSTKYPVIRELQTGEAVELVATEGKWAKVVSGGTEGYVFAKYLSKEKPLSANTLLTANRSVNVRSKPTAASKKLGKLQKGESVTLIAIRGRWAEISWNGASAYVYRKYFTEQAQADAAYQFAGAVTEFFEKNYSGYLLGIYLDNESGKLCVRVTSNASTAKIMSALERTDKVDVGCISILSSSLPFYANKEYVSGMTQGFFSQYSALSYQIQSKIRLSAASYDPAADKITVELINKDSAAEKAFRTYISDAEYITFTSASSYDVPMV